LEETLTTKVFVAVIEVGGVVRFLGGFAGVGVGEVAVLLLAALFVEVVVRVGGSGMVGVAVAVTVAEGIVVVVTVAELLFGFITTGEDFWTTPFAIEI
jgi:hypothetical protein